MPTIVWNGGTTAQFTHPRDLRNYGYPVPPRQPAVDWPFTFNAFVNMVNHDQFDEAIKWLVDEYCVCRISDVPEEKREAFRRHVEKRYRTGPVADDQVVGAP